MNYSLKKKKERKKRKVCLEKRFECMGMSTAI